MSRVLLLNPPVERVPILRDFACGESAKADYYWAPIDLLVLSGLLRDRHELAVIDAVAEGLDVQQALARAEAFAPDTTFSLTSAVSLVSDDRFLAQLADRTGSRIYGLGDVASFDAERALGRTRAFDGMILNFADPSLNDLAAGNADAVTSIVLRTADGVDTRRTDLQAPMRYAMPRHELFPLDRYRLPFTKWRGSTTVMSAYGCPFSCTFCASGNLPWQQRPIDDVIDELRYVASLGLKEFYMRDFTFGPTRDRAKELCDALIAADLDLEWSAECRVEVLDEEVLDLMHKAGCQVILCGIEVGNDEVAKRMGKRVDEDRTERILSYARAIGIRSCGHFVLGSPGETKQEAQETIRYARELSLDYAAFNLFAPRLGTDMRTDLVALGRVDADDFDGQDVSVHANSYAGMDASTLAGLRRWAIASFYLRPSQMARLLRCTPWSTLRRQGTAVLGGLLTS